MSANAKFLVRPSNMEGDRVCKNKLSIILRRLLGEYEKVQFDYWVIQSHIGSSKGAVEN